MNAALPEAGDRPRKKLGLALAGGGFRASLFHVGVLRRLAELDVLRSVEVLSTVSGGSIVGALYVLLLKQELEASESGSLTRDEYCALIDRLEGYLVRGIRHNLRTRLFVDPLPLLKVMLGPESLGNQMARLYEQYIYAEVVGELRAKAGDAAKWPKRKGGIPLTALRIDPGGKRIEGGVEAYNERACREGRSVITRIVINSTALNSGGRFCFSSVELGDWYLGYSREDEVNDLQARKQLLTRLRGRERAPIGEDDFSPDTRALAAWWVARVKNPDSEPASGWEEVFRNRSGIGRLSDADPGLLRQAKVPAWYFAFGEQYGVSGGTTRAMHWANVVLAVSAIDGAFGARLQQVRPDSEFAQQLCRFIVEVYLLRSADQFSGQLKQDWEKLTVGDAVGASANFPPVFPPFIMLGIYDDLHVARLGLTDGGVYDNTGLRALIDEGCTSVIASDTGGPFVTQRYSSTGHIGLVLRIPNIMMRALGGYQKLDVRQRRRYNDALRGVASQVPEGAASAQMLLEEKAGLGLDHVAYFQINSPPPPGDHIPDRGLPAEDLANIRTDLDGFGDVEVAALISRGWDVADRYVRAYLKDVPAVQRWKDIPAAVPFSLATEQPERKRQLTVLKAGQARFFRAIKVHAPVSMLVVFVVAAALVWAGIAGVSIREAFAGTWSTLRSVAAVGGQVVNSIPVIGPWLHTAFTFVPEHLPAAARWLLTTERILVLVAAAIALRKLSTLLAPRFRGLRTSWKWLVGLRGNLLWLVWAAPFWLVLGSATLFSLSIVLFYIPWFLRARLKE